MTSAIGLSLLGAGNIGLAVVGAIQHAGERYAARVGAPLEIRRVLVRDTSRPRPGVDPAQVTDSIDDVLGDEATQIVIEFMGGEEPARTYLHRGIATRAATCQRACPSPDASPAAAGAARRHWRPRGPDRAPRGGIAA